MTPTSSWLINSIEIPLPLGSRGSKPVLTQTRVLHILSESEVVTFASHITGQNYTEIRCLNYAWQQISQHFTGQKTHFIIEFSTRLHPKMLSTKMTPRGIKCIAEVRYCSHLGPQRTTIDTAGCCVHKPLTYHQNAPIALKRKTHC